MSSTKMSKRGANPDRISDKMFRFCQEYAKDYNGARAVVRAGYPKKNADVMAAKLLKHPVVAAIIGKARKENYEECKLDVKEILQQLCYIATRSGADFVDEEGRLIENIRDLPKRAQNAIDGIEQDVETWVDGQGNEHTKVRTKLRLVPKAVGVDMAMKHFGQYAAEQVNVNVIKIDWDEKERLRQLKPDTVQQRLTQEEANVIETEGKQVP